MTLSANLLPLEVDALDEEACDWLVGGRLRLPSCCEEGWEGIWEEDRLEGDAEWIPSEPDAARLWSSMEECLCSIGTGGGGIDGLFSLAIAPEGAS